MSRRELNIAGAARMGFSAAIVLAGSICARAQQKLPDAPSLNLLAAAAQTATAPQTGQTSAAPGTTPQNTQTTPAVNANSIHVGSQNAGPTLTVEQAEQIAIRSNPNISVARLLALAQGQVTREARSADLPLITGDLTAVGAHDQSRLTGEGTLNSPRVLDKAAGGLSISQLITDFGRTRNLIKSAQSNARAQTENEHATELDIRLAVDQAFYQALTSQAILKVAQETVAQRVATGDQVNALTRSKVKSELDLSFANVQVSQANLMLLNAKNNEQAAMAALNAVLGSDQDQQYILVDETSGTPQPAPTDAEALVQTAFQQRPDLAALNDQYLSARHYATAQRDLWFPTVSALGATGATPVRDDLIKSNWYLGAGANISIPVFNGFLFNADTKEARYRASAAQEQIRNLRDMVARDVRTAVLNAQTAFERIGVTQDMLNQANFALDLSQARYKIGLSSIVELTQGQLAQTQAAIDYTNARYSYQTALAELRYELGQ
ncbi:MAG: TolC family protein [Acidobacteriota bacterium]